MYFADGRWWEWHDAGVACKTLGLSAAEVQQRFREFAGQKVSIWGNESHKILDDAVFRLRNAGDDHKGGVLSTQPNGLATGRNSGFQAINLAVLAGAARILLLGYDMKARAEQPHWFGDHPLPTSPRTIDGFVHGYNKLARHMPPGVEIINCSADTALTCFPRAAIESVLPDPLAAVVPA